jgi:GNAT superfamily N-acetyltransferase
MTSPTTFDRKSLIEIRDYQLNDRNFILATWLRGLYYGDTFFGEVPKDIFMESYHVILERYLDREGVRVKIACLKDDPDVILGYAAFRTIPIHGDPTQVLDWIFVKSSWRHIGIGKSLIPSQLRAFTHATKSGLSIAKTKYPHLIYNPFIFG